MARETGNRPTCLFCGTPVQRRAATVGQFAVAHPACKSRAVHEAHESWRKARERSRRWRE